MCPLEDDFEAPIRELLDQLESLDGFYPNAETRQRRLKLTEKLQETRRRIYAGLSPWQRCLVARHPGRPYTLDYVRILFQDFVELHGDRRYADDHAVVAGFADYHGEHVCVIGHQKGRSTKDRIYRNFGCARPEGYRKALRVMKLAEKFGRPVFTFVDTPGAYPGIDAEERGQAEAIARNLLEMARLRVPVIVTIIGEGGSGGALGIGVGDRILIQEHATYSVISPEGCASILWRDSEKKKEAAAALRLTAPDLKEMGLVDEVVPEALGGAHADPEETAHLLDERLTRALGEVRGLESEERVRLRYEKFRRMGACL